MGSTTQEAVLVVHRGAQGVPGVRIVCEVGHRAIALPRCCVNVGGCYCGRVAVRVCVCSYTKVMRDQRKQAEERLKSLRETAEKMLDAVQRKQ